MLIFTRACLNVRMLAVFFILSIFSATGQNNYRWTRYCTADEKNIYLKLFDTKTTIKGYDGDSIVVQLLPKDRSCNNQLTTLHLVSEPKESDSFLVKIEKGNDGISLMASVMDEGRYSISIMLPNWLFETIDCYSTCPYDSLVISNLHHLVNISGEVKQMSVSNIWVSHKLNINTKSDNISIDHIELERNLNNRIADSLFNCTISTSGNVSLLVRKDIEAKLTVFSKGGVIYSNLPFNNIQKNLKYSPYLVGTSFSGVLNKPSSSVYVRTVYGNVLVQSE